MKQKINLFIYILQFVVFPNNFFAQEFNLKLSSDKAIDLIVLEKVDFKKKHADSISVLNEIKKVSFYLKNLGYFTNTYSRINRIDKNYIARFSLGEKINKVIIRNNSKDILMLIDYSKENDSIIIPIDKLKYTLNTISKKLDSQGKSFSRVQLSNIEIKNKMIFADLKVYQSKKRKIDKVIIKGYEQFPKPHIKHHFNLKENTIFNKNKIEDISSLTKSLQFVKESKKPEVLFTRDSTLLYIYLKKHQNSSFDGLVNFTSKENGGVLFNGYLDLKLNNILNKGERFELFWNSIGEEKQEFKVSTEIPYLFNTPISPSISFNLFRQDSTFLNTEFKTNISYSINPKIKIAATYSSVNSKNLQENITSNAIEEFKSSFFGLKFSYAKPNNDSFNNDIFFLEINPTFGNRNSKNSSTKQFRIELTTSYMWDIGKKNTVFFKNNSGYLKSDDFLNNELFRIGGANTIRGFNEQSIYANYFSTFTMEYRFLTSPESYIYSITDLASVGNGINNENLLGIGIGYLFKTSSSVINLSTAIGKSASNTFDFNKSKIIISWKNYF